MRGRHHERAMSSSRIGGFALTIPIISVAVGSMGYAAWRINWPALVQSFLTGPGRTSRVLLLLFIVFNWKTLPLAWTYRIFYAMLYHMVFRKSQKLGPRALFKPMISDTKAALLEIDYNLHKSNSTYFADLDVSRTHLCAYLLRDPIRSMSNNLKTRLVLDPRTGQPVKGNFAIALGSVMCSFKREISPYQSYEIWSRVACWDRKWLYIISYFMPKGAARPTEWLDPNFRRVRTRDHKDATSGWEKKIHATAMSKYVFKVGRFTVHPAIVLNGAGLLPPRPGGWQSGENYLGDESVDLSDVNLTDDDEWDWRRVEAQRREGMKLASQFHALDGLHDSFDGGNYGALARFGPG